MFKVTKEIVFCYGHRLMNYDGKCKNLHGHNGRVEIEIESESLDDRGMVVDFSEAKQVIEEWIDTNIDHKTLLQKDDPLLEALKAFTESIFILKVNPTAENIAKLIFDFAVSQGFPVSEVRLWETGTSFATYSRPAK